MNREKRRNAGNRMSQLLDQEDCNDEFYIINYGGFTECETDNDYQLDHDEEDSVDSDFSIDEYDEPISDNEEDRNRKKRKLFTKAYKEPTCKPTKIKHQLIPAPVIIKPNIVEIPIETITERKTVRESTAVKSAATAQRVRIRNQEQKKKVKKPKEDEWIPTQQELLEEAKITAEENIQSLEKYQKMESQKKMKKINKKIYTGPIIKYQSLRMPLIEEIDGGQHFERTLISFLNDPDDEVFNRVMKTRTAARAPPKLKCTITNLPAKYMDPVTGLPYHNSRCFKLIRETYYQQLETHGDPSNPEVEEWLKWYSKNKDKLKLSSAVKSSMQNWLYSK